VSRAFSYIRFSSKKQQKGESFRRQAEFAVEVCRENGWVLDETLTLNATLSGEVDGRIMRYEDYKSRTSRSGSSAAGTG
jgi:hypothetical protein